MRCSWIILPFWFDSIHFVRPSVSVPFFVNVIFFFFFVSRFFSINLMHCWFPSLMSSSSSSSSSRFFYNDEEDKPFAYFLFLSVRSFHYSHYLLRSDYKHGGRLCYVNSFDWIDRKGILDQTWRISFEVTHNQLLFNLPLNKQRMAIKRVKIGEWLWRFVIMSAVMKKGFLSILSFSSPRKSKYFA